jgi:hydrogenase/urease accessory protein HupE
MHRATLIVLLSAGEALAHPHHGSGGWLLADWLHLLSEPDHLAMILLPLAVGAGWLLRRALRIRASRRASAVADARRDR